MMSAVRWLASAVLLLSVAGCASWHPKTGPTATVLATPHETDVVGTALWGFSIVAVALAVATLLVVLLGKPYEF